MKIIILFLILIVNLNYLLSQWVQLIDEDTQQPVLATLAVIASNDTIVSAFSVNLMISTNNGRNWRFISITEEFGKVSVYNVTIVNNEIILGTTNGIYKYDGKFWYHLGLQGYSIYSLVFTNNILKNLILKFTTHSANALSITNYDKLIRIDVLHLFAGVYYLRFGSVGRMFVKM